MESIKNFELFLESNKAAGHLFQLVNAYINTLENVKTEIFKTQVSYKTKKLFAAIWLPQMWIKKRDGNSITLSFFLHKAIENGKITEVIEPRKGYFTHHIVLNSVNDFDDDVKFWIREAYNESSDKA